jgi:hypothetical protein
MFATATPEIVWSSLEVAAAEWDAMAQAAKDEHYDLVAELMLDGVAPTLDEAHALARSLGAQLADDAVAWDVEQALSQLAPCGVWL